MFVSWLPFPFHLLSIPVFFKKIVYVVCVCIYTYIYRYIHADTSICPSIHTQTLMTRTCAAYKYSALVHVDHVDQYNDFRWFLYVVNIAHCV